MRAKPSCEHHIGLLGEQKPDRFQTHSRHSARCTRFSFPTPFQPETTMTATARLEPQTSLDWDLTLRLMCGRPNGSRVSCGALQKNSFLNLRAPSASSAVRRHP